jgi:hypothetical protein
MAGKDDDTWKQRTSTCKSCGQERPTYTAFPRGVRKPCRVCLYGPPPRARFVSGGAPGMGKRHGKRRR